MDEMKEQLSIDGFFILDLLNEEEIKFLNNLCNKYLNSDAGEFLSSSHFLSVEDSKKINEALHKIIKPKMQNLFPDLSVLGGTLATKIKGKSILKAHNDWSIVEEEKYNSYNLWIALIDTDSKNGTLGLLPGSHLWKTNPRGLNIPGEYEQFTSKFLQIGCEPALKAGQAILYNHKLIHYSRPNTTEFPRNVAIVGMKDREAALRVSFTTDSKTIKTYEAEEDDFYGFDVQNILKNKIIAETALQQSKLAWNSIVQLYDLYCPVKYKKNIPITSFWTKWKEYLKMDLK